MAADANLMQVMITAEYAKNVPDYSKIFEMSYGGVDAIMKGTLSAVENISTAVSEKNKLEAEKQKVIAEDLKVWKEGVLNDFDTSANEFYKQIATREEGGKEAGMNPAIKNYAWEYMEGVRGELEDLVNKPKTRETAKGIMDLESKAQKFIDGLVGMRGDLLTFAQQAGSSDSESSVNKEATLAWDGGDGMQMASRLFKLDEEGWKGVTPGMDDKGMFVNMDRQAVLSKEELIEKGYNEFTADELIKYGHNTEVVTEKLYASDLSKLVQWKDEESSTAIMTEVITGAEMADTDDIKTRIALGDLTLDETTGQWRDVNGNPIFDVEGVKDNIAKNIRTSDSGDDKENLYDMIYREFNGQGSSYAEATKNHPIIQTARYAGVTVGDLGPADADGDLDVELTKTDEGFVDESGNLVSDQDWITLQGKLLKPRTKEEKDAVAEDIAWYFAKQSEGKFNEKVDLLNRIKKRNDEVSNKNNLTKVSNYHDTSFGSISKIRANNYVNKINDNAKTVTDLKGYTWDLQPDGTYKSQVTDENDKHVIRDRTQMLEQVEMDSFYPDIYKGLLNTASAELFDPNIGSDDVWLMPKGTPEHKAWIKRKKEESEEMRVEQTTPGKGHADDPITLKKGEKPKRGKYYKLKTGIFFYDGTRYIPKDDYLNK